VSKWFLSTQTKAQSEQKELATKTALPSRSLERILVKAKNPKPLKGKRFTVVYTWIRDNDPSAGSPTETLLRLLLPLNDQV
jgi:hypothetical protein